MSPFCGPASKLQFDALAAARHGHGATQQYLVFGRSPRGGFGIGHGTGRHARDA
jgi:hypothetical protein